MRFLGLLTGMLCLCLFQAKGQSTSDTAQPQTPASFIGVDSSISHRDVRYFLLSETFPYQLPQGCADTGITGEQRRESLLGAHNIYQTLSTIGQAHQSLNYAPSLQAGFRYATLPYPCYQRRLATWRQCEVDGVYTLLQYEKRNGQENAFEVEHAQQTGNFRYNLALQTRLSNGIYVNEGVRDINLGFSGLHHSDTNRYGFGLSFVYNLFTLHESGGIANDSDYYAGLEARAIEVNTPTALNRGSDHHFSYRHWLRLQNQRDSNGRFTPSHMGYLTHQLDYKGMHSTYTETDFNRESHPFPAFDSMNTADFIHGRQLRNILGWSNVAPCLRADTAFRLFFGLSHEHIRMEDTLGSFHSDVCALHALAQLPLRQWGNWGHRVYYAFSGYNAGDLHYQTDCTLPLLRKTSDSTRQRIGFFRTSLRYAHYEADYLFSHYVSNYFCWDNQLKKQQHLQWEALLDIKGCQLALRNHILTNHTYLTEDLRVRQHDKSIQVLQGEVFLPLQWKGLGANLHAYVQHSNSDSLHLPAFCTRNSLFYGFPVFHDKAYVQFGVEGLYFTAYYADAYQASLRQFHNQSGTLIGNDLYLNGFINARIEHFHISFAYTNALAALPDFHPFLFPHYPAKGAGFRIGVSWRFYD